MGTRSNQVRIIAGLWRGRKLDFPDVEGLRPTADRIRETLFNWLAPALPGSSCLDLFAGSGALGYEAASRGAARVVLVDRERAAVANLERMRQMLRADTVQVICDDAGHFVAATGEAFDIIFLDPPFADNGRLESIVASIESGALLKPGGFLYLESAKGHELCTLPESMQVHRSKQAGQVYYQLLRYCPAGQAGG